MPLWEEAFSVHFGGGEAFAGQQFGMTSMKISQAMQEPTNTGIIYTHVCVYIYNKFMPVSAAEFQFLMYNSEL
jgi:hypothetical protein